MGRPKKGEVRPPVVKRVSTVTPSTRCCKSFSYAQCIVCKNVYSVGARGRLPRCSGCTGILSRITHLEGN